MNGSRVALRQMRYENRAFWRNPAAAGLTLFFPVLFLVIFNVLLGNEGVTRFGTSLEMADFYAPAIATFSVINACYTGLAMSLVLARDAEVLKRKRATPVPTWAFLAGRILHAVGIALLLVLIVVSLSRLFFGAQFPAAPVMLVLTAVLGALSFAALGTALTGWIPNVEAAPAVVNISIWPLLFISGLFFPALPTWLARVADFFPIKPFFDAMFATFQDAVSPRTWVDLLVVSVWGTGAFLLALKSFRWEPRR